MKILKTILFCCFWLIAPTLSYAQIGTHIEDKSKVLFSGVVLENNNEAFVPYTQIFITNKQLGCLSNKEGYFSFYAQRGDSIRFSALGFQEAYFIIPDTLSKNHCPIIQLLAKDTVTLAETIIYPWPVNETDFVQSFLAYDEQDEKTEIAKQNLAISAIKQPQSVIFDEGDAAYNFDETIKVKAQENYLSGQVQSIPLLDPFAWWRFIKAWRRGDFKNKKHKP